LARLARDGVAREELADTLSLEQVFVDDFAGVYCVGLPGPIWRVAGEASIEAVLARFLRAGKPVAVCPSNLDLSPHGAGEGLLITGEATQSALLVAQTLLAATRAREDG
jgi:putative intracellular protease/amidase